MNVDEALRQFAAAEEMPGAAMQWALDHWDEASPRFVGRLRAYAAGAGRSDTIGDELFFVVHLCGEKHDERAFAPLCRVIGEGEEASSFLGDAAASTLNGILINVYDGDPAPLMRAIESSSGEEFARAAALEALGYLVRTKNVLGDDEMRAYLRRLNAAMRTTGESWLWTIWAMTAANLGFADFRADVESLHADRLLDDYDFSLAEFDERVERVRQDPAGLAGFEADEVEPFEGAIETLAQWSFAEESEFDPAHEEAFADEAGEDEAFDDEAGEEEARETEAPYVNPFRDVGRNDPCPCGSGKKYKKCCLAA